VSNACQMPACAAFAYSATGEVISAVSESGIQDIPAGVTPDGSTILAQRGEAQCSDGMTLLIADETVPGSGAYEVQVVAAPAGMYVTHEEYVTLTADGRTLISTTMDRTGFLSSTRSQIGAIDFGPPSQSDFVNLSVTLPWNVWAPILSADGLAFYYVVFNDSGNATPSIYESVRASTSVPFPPGQPMPDLVQQLAQYVNGLSVDRMAIFLETPATFQTVVLTRSSLTAPFANPNAPAPPPLVPGFRTRPLASCTRLVGTCSTPGGCANEDICFYDAP
jgi:hypothetical protein